MSGKTTCMNFRLGLPRVHTGLTYVLNFSCSVMLPEEVEAAFIDDLKSLGLDVNPAPQRNMHLAESKASSSSNQLVMNGGTVTFKPPSPRQT